LLEVAPLASSWAIESIGDSPDATWSSHREKANAEVNSRLRGKVAVPYSGDSIVASGLAEVEARLTASRLIKANISKFQNNIDTTMEVADRYVKDAYKLLDDIYFPASASAATTGTSFVGNGTVSVSVDNSFAYRTTLTIRCLGDNIFQIEDDRERTGGPYNYDISNDNQWPSDQDIDALKPDYKALSITIATGVTAFSEGDYWTMEVYPAYKKTMRKGLGWLPIGRR